MSPPHGNMAATSKSSESGILTNCVKSLTAMYSEYLQGQLYENINKLIEGIAIVIIVVIGHLYSASLTSLKSALYMVTSQTKGLWLQTSKLLLRDSL